MTPEEQILSPEVGNDPPGKRLYDRMYKDGVYTKSYAEFEKQFSNRESIDRLYKRLKEDGKYTKDVNTFYTSFFPDARKPLVKGAVAQPTQQQQQPFKIEISQPTFKPGVRGPKERTFEYSVEGGGRTELQKVLFNANEAQKKLSQEIKGNDDTVEKMIRQRRFEQAAEARDIPRSDQPKLSFQLETERLVEPETKPQDLPVTPEEMSVEKLDIEADESKARRLIEQVIKDKPDKAGTLQKDVYLLDKGNSLAQSGNAQERSRKILRNADWLEKGKLDYNVRTGQLIRPEGFIASGITGWKQKSQLFSDFDFFTKSSDEEIITELNKRQAEYDPDEPIPVPRGKVAEVGQMVGGMPVAPLVAAAVPSALGAPEIAPFMAAGVGAEDFSKMGFAGELTRAYYEFKQQGLPDQEALNKARELAKKSAMGDAAMGAAMGFIGGRMGGRPLPRPDFSQGYRNAIVNTIRRSGGWLKPATLEGLAGGGIGAGGQLYKNALAQEAGLDREIDEGVLEQIEGNLLLTVGIAGAAKLGRGLSKQNYKSILNGLSRLKPEALEGKIQEMVATGELSEKQVQNVNDELFTYRTLDQTIPENVTEEARFSIQDKLKRKAELESKLETWDKAFHPDLKEKIKKIDEEVIDLSKQTEKPIKEETGLTKEQEKDAIDFANELVEEGIIEGVYEEAIKTDPIGFWRDIAQQAQNRDANWKPLTEALPEQAVIDQYGETVVQYAKELFPAPEIKESSISVIRPEERTQPTETITIKPKEDALPIESAAEIPVRETPEDSGPVAGEVRSATEPTGKEGTAEEGNVAGEKVGGEPEMLGITHEQMNQTARELGLAEYEGDPETVAGWDAEAETRMKKDPEAINKLFDKLRKGEKPDAPETRMMIMYMADLKAKYNKNPSPELLNDIKRAKDLFNIVGREQGKAFRARQGSQPVEETLSDFHVRDVEYNKGAPLTEKQTEQSTKEFQEIRDAKKTFEDDISRLEDENAKLKAEQKIKQEQAKAKKSDKKDYKGERKQIIDDIREKLRKVRGETSVVVVPYAKELIAIAPDVAKLITNLAEEGIAKLPEVIKSVHTTLKDLIPEITEKDVHNIIAGEYNKPKPKRSEVAEKVFNLKLEAKLINKLEALEAGVQPKNESKRIKRNQEIEELRQKIKELTKSEITDEQKLQALKTRTKNEIAKLEEQLKKGDFEPEIKEPLKLDKEAQESRDKLLKLREDREIRLMKQQYGNIKGLEKVYREADQYLNISRQLKSTGDVSMPFRQGLVGLARELLTIPIEFKDGKLRFTNFMAQRQLATQFADMYMSLAKENNYRRIMADMKESPRWDIAEKAGLKMADPNSPLAEAREEFMYPSKLEKIQGAKQVVQASNRAATVFINKMKWDVFNNFVDVFEGQGKTLDNSPDAYKEAAIYANQIVGRGHLGSKLEMANFITSRAFFSLRLQASRLQLLTKWLNPKFYTKVPPEVRVAYFKDMAKTVALGYGVVMAAKAAGLDVEWDPSSSEFGKIKVGNTVYDVWGGFQQYVVLFSRMLSGETKSARTGKISELGNEKFGQKNRGDVLLRFLRSKASPEVGIATDIITGQTFDFQPTTFKGEAINFITPLLWKDVYQAWQDEGVQTAFLTALLAGHGVGVLTYDEDQKKETEERGSRQGRSGREGRQGRQ